MSVMCICAHMWCVYLNIFYVNIDSRGFICFVYIALPVITTHPNDNGTITVLEGSNVTLRCEATGEGTLNYQWIRVSGPSPGVYLKNKGTNLTISDVTVNDTGEYYCKVDNGGTSVSSMGVHVIVKSKLHKIN